MIDLLLDVLPIDSRSLMNSWQAEESEQAALVRLREAREEAVRRGAAELTNFQRGVQMV